MLRLGIVLGGTGLVVVGYTLTVGVTPLVPTIPMPRLLRWALFAIGMVLLSLGLAITVEELAARRNHRGESDS